MRGLVTKGFLSDGLSPAGRDVGLCRYLGDIGVEPARKKRQREEAGAPAEPLTRVAIWTVGRRIGADLDRFDWVRRAGDLRRPVLVLHSDADTYVPDGPAKRVAAARPDLVTLHLTPGAEHTRGWNVDPEGFDAAMRSWLARVGALPAPVPQTS